MRRLSVSLVALLAGTASGFPHPSPALLRATPRIGRSAGVAAVATPARPTISSPSGFPAPSRPLTPSPAPLSPRDQWAADLDYAGFEREVRALGKRLGREQGPADVAHLKRMIRASNFCGALGLATMWVAPGSPLGILSVLALSTWSVTRWTMIAHHTCHGGYNRQDDGSGRFTSTGFALGSLVNRCRDWFDWMLPEAWNVEHNNLHHFRLGEEGDPDLVERNLEFLRVLELPRALKYAAVAGLGAIWKWYYYAPNTYKQLKIRELKTKGTIIPEEEAHEAFTLPTLIQGQGPKYGFSALEYMGRVMGPFLLLRFLLLPAPLALINPAFYFAALANLALSDVVSNLHSFIIISTNHVGSDLYRFERSVTPKSGSFYMRAVTSSANFRTANGVREDGAARPVHGFTADLNDLMHGWLNYQIEHHVWPDLSMLSYQKAAPELRAICEKYGVPYVQESVFKRLKKTADVMVGAASMRKFDRAWELERDVFEWK